MNASHSYAALPLGVAAAVFMVACGGGGGDSGGGDTTAPSIVTGLSVTAGAANQLRLAWNAATDNVGVSGYKVYRAVSPAATTYFQNSTGTSLTDSGLSAGSTYCYQVSAVDAAGNESTRSAQQCATVGPVFDGFNFALAQGSFWEYRWDYRFVSVAQGSSPTTTTDRGRFWVVLGAPMTIQGTTAYAVQRYGKSIPADTRSSYAPRWTHLALANNRLLGSTDGTTLVPVFDAYTGKWPGGGFFTTWPSNKLTEARSGTINTGNTYVSGSALVASRSTSQSQCEYFPGVGTICGDSSYAITEHEYYRPWVGPVGYYYFHTYSDCGGGFCSGGTWTEHLGLTASSFTSSSSPLISESEPNDSAATADPLSASAVVTGTVAESALVNQGNSPVTYVIGTTTVTATVEDWFALTLSSTRTVTITLSFEEAPTSDLDLLLMDANGAVLAYSVDDNPTTRVLSEKVTRTLPAGQYRIGVDGYRTPAGSVRYTVQVE